MKIHGSAYCPFSTHPSAAWPLWKRSRDCSLPSVPLKVVGNPEKFAFKKGDIVAFQKPQARAENSLTVPILHKLFLSVVDLESWDSAYGKLQTHYWVYIIMAC